MTSAKCTNDKHLSRKFVEFERKSGTDVQLTRNFLLFRTCSCQFISTSFKLPYLLPPVRRLLLQSSLGSKIAFTIFSRLEDCFYNLLSARRLLGQSSHKLLNTCGTTEIYSENLPVKPDLVRSVPRPDPGCLLSDNSRTPFRTPPGMPSPTRYILRRRPLRRTPPKWPCQVLFRQNQVLFSKKRGIFVHSADGERNVLIRPFQRHILCRVTWSMPETPETPVLTLPFLEPVWIRDRSPPADGSTISYRVLAFSGFPAHGNHRR